MLDSEPYHLKARPANRRISLVKGGPPIPEDKPSCKQELLVFAPDGSVRQCRCGVFHVRINAVTLHLTPRQFDAAARLFKLAWGMVAGRRGSASMSRFKRFPIAAFLVTGLFWGLT